LVVTESLFSMDGDRAPLSEIVELKNRYGAWLMVDEAHAFGVMGNALNGLVSENGLTDQVEVQMGTLGKAVGAAGGFVCGSRALIDLLTNRARSFIFSTAPPPVVTAAAEAGIRLIRSEEGRARAETLWENVDAARAGLAQLGWGSSSVMPSHILPVAIGAESRAVAAAESLLDQGILLPAIRYPTVARKQARLRLALSAAHRKEDIGRLLEALSSCGLRAGEMR
jgi:7-keto-8-aminopelargonate synthetase-like enzyme